MPRLYIQYQNNSPVPIFTQNLPVPQGEEPVVADLVAAYQSLPNSPLASSFVGDLTLHLPDGVDRSALDQDCFASLVDKDTTLEPGCPVSSLGAIGSRSRQPLVIKSKNDTITVNEYMLWPLPRPVYRHNVSNANTSGHYSRPAHVVEWAGFGSLVLNWIQSNYNLHSAKRIARPEFDTSIVIYDEIQGVQPFVKSNLLNVSSKCFIPASEFTNRRELQIDGDPDHIMVRDGQLVAIVEEKGKWTLSTRNVIDAYFADPSSASAVNQIYHYLRLNHRKYGILTTYEYTWFVYRSLECTDTSCKEECAHDSLYVSEGISYSDENPSVLQCLAYFNSIVDSTYVAAPPLSKRPSRSSSLDQLSRSTSSKTSSHASPRGSLVERGSPLSNEIQIQESEQDFDVDDFTFEAVIAEGRSKVYLDYYGSHRIALKVADVSKRRDMLSELLNEVSVYEELSYLQGNGIPRLFCHGFIEQILYCVGVSICGRVTQSWTEDQKDKLFDTLERIHDAGILHNDIKKENILIDEAGNPYLIDFGFATRSSCPDSQLEERNRLRRLLESS